eukprot:TRINITY_DN6505_c0_g1_i2.p1 TRINITY_DN6505_c0_g1~~TRINITY_DN6505_c0_g1_i2.p1  ORF type:complete len:347 (-),score=41.36 TRINITY_DN6505_c0_g1_i2:62-1102(-)
MKLLVEGPTSKKVIDVAVASLDDLRIKIENTFSIASSFRLEYWEADFAEYVELDDLSSINDKAKIKVIVSETNTITNPWCFDVHIRNKSEWVSKGFEHTPYRSLLLQDSHSVYFPQEMEKVRYLLNQFHNGTNLKISKAYAIDNHRLSQDFESYLLRLANKHRSAPQVFQSTSWQQESNVTWRQWVLDHLLGIYSKCSWNQGTLTPVVTMLQGTSEDVVWQICQNGFAVVAARDDGWYGRGIYFTSYSNYALIYSLPNASGEKVLTINYVVPGACYPVIENPKDPQNSLIGKPCQKGYQSHYVRVFSNESQSFGLPATEGTAKSYDEFVSFQESQALIKYIIFVKD